MVKDIDFESLEHTTFRVPYEELNRIYRNGHKNIEKSLTKVNKIGQIVGQKLKNNSEPIPIDSIKKLYGTLCQNVEEAQKIFVEINDGELEQTRKFLHRIDALEEEAEIDEEKNPLLDLKYQRLRTARYAIWYLLRCGHIETAKIMAKSYGLEDMVDIDVFEQCKLVENALLEKNTKPCLEWIDSHRSKLRRMNSRLEIVVRQQDIIDLCQKRQYIDALKYARKYISPIAKGEHHEDLQMIMAIISISPATSHEKYADFKMEERWRNCAKMFISEMYRLYQLPQQSTFSICLQSGLAAYKTPSCKCDPRPPKEVDCYVCKKSMWPIAEGLPNAHVTVSRILCSMTGEPCDEKNVPYLLPSGHVYGQKAIDRLRKDDVVVCPETGNLVPIQDVHRLFFL